MTAVNAPPVPPGATGISPEPSPPSPAETTTPTVRGALRRGRFWILVAAIALVGAVAVILINGGIRGPGRPLAADNPAPDGAMALAEVLRSEGVTVTAVESFEELIVAADGEATIFVHDALRALDAERIDELATMADALVVAGPDFMTLDTLAPDVAFGGVAGGGPLDAECALPAAERAERVPAGLDTLTIRGEEDGVWSGCFPSPHGGFALVYGQARAGASAALIAATEVFANGTITAEGSAALALGLLGEHEHLIWYVPGLGDLVGEAPSLAELTPGWLTPLIVLLGVVTVCAAIWRGRRFGPLVIEDLPVVVRASETMEGRARLYARTGSRARALDNLRVGAVDRLARHLALGPAASIPEISAAAAEATGLDPRRVGELLGDAQPLTDADLVRLAGELTDLEHAVALATQPPQAAEGRES